MRNSFEKESRSAALGTVIIVIAMVIVFGAVFLWMYSMELLLLPDFIENILGISDRGNDAGRAPGALSEIVKSGKDEENSDITFEITYENLRDAVLREPTTEGIYICADVGYYRNGEASLRRIHFWRNGGSFRSEIYAVGDSDKLETVKIADNEYVTVIDSPTSESRKIVRSADITPENDVGIPSVDALLSAIEAFPEYLNAEDSVYTADGDTLSECTIEMVRYEDSNAYLVSFVYADLGLTEEYYVSLEHNIILSCITQKDGVPVYSYNVVSISDDPAVWSDEMLYSVTEYSKSTEK